MYIFNRGYLLIYLFMEKIDKSSSYLKIKRWLQGTKEKHRRECKITMKKRNIGEWLKNTKEKKNTTHNLPEVKVV